MNEAYLLPFFLRPHSLCCAWYQLTDTVLCGKVCISLALGLGPQPHFIVELVRQEGLVEPNLSKWGRGSPCLLVSLLLRDASTPSGHRGRSGTWATVEALWQ